MDFSGLTVLCLGDVMLDRFAYGVIERISPEAPIPIIRQTDIREMLGGAGNVAHNISELGGRAILIGLVGMDQAADALNRILSGIPTIQGAFVASRHRPTICKTRYIAGRQQVVRADDESPLATQPDEEERLLDKFRCSLDGVHALVLSDYGKATLSGRVAEYAISIARSRKIPVFVDPKLEDFAAYRNADCITPNSQELRRASRMVVDTDADVVAAARVVLQRAEARAILVTRSERGMMLIQADGAVHRVAAQAREVYDVSGAGDTAIATLALSHAAGLPLARAMVVANAAAGVVVSKLGTATATVAEVLRELEADDHLAGSSSPSLISESAVVAQVVRWRDRGLAIGFTNGCFDVLHSGHVALLAAAKSQCDKLIVGLNTDASVSTLKGPTRPVNDVGERSRVLAALRSVDAIVAFDDPTPYSLIKRLQPDVLVKGSDYAEDEVVGADIVKAAGGQVVLVEFVQGQSTTRTLERMMNLAPGPVS